MNQKPRQPLTWLVKNFDCNSQEIKDYDILKYREDMIKKLKKKYPTKETFAEALRKEMMYHFWSKCECEVIIEITDEGYILLKPWVGCSEPEKVAIDVTDDESFNWYDFAKIHIAKQIYKNEAKIDIFDQLDYNWNKFVDYCWNYQHKWQRKPKEIESHK